MALITVLKVYSNYYEYDDCPDFLETSVSDWVEIEDNELTMLREGISELNKSSKDDSRLFII